MLKNTLSNGWKAKSRSERVLLFTNFIARCAPHFVAVRARPPKQEHRTGTATSSPVGQTLLAQNKRFALKIELK